MRSAARVGPRNSTLPSLGVQVAAPHRIRTEALHRGAGATCATTSPQRQRSQLWDAPGTHQPSHVATEEQPGPRRIGLFLPSTHFSYDLLRPPNPFGSRRSQVSNPAVPTRRNPAVEAARRALWRRPLAPVPARSASYSSRNERYEAAGAVSRRFRDHPIARRQPSAAADRIDLSRIALTRRVGPD